MNILQIVPRLDIGGVETGTVDLAKYLKQKGHHSVVISNGGRLVKELELWDIKHITLPVHKKYFWVMLSQVKQVIEIVRREKIDVIHARSRVPAWIAYFVSKRLDVALITTAHGLYSRHIFSKIMGSGRLVIVPSQVIAEHMQKVFGVPLGLLRVIPRSVDLKKFLFHPPSKSLRESFIVGVVGRVTPIKGQIYLLEAVVKLREAIPCLEVWIVGDVSPGKESYGASLRNFVKKHNLQDRVKFLGANQDIASIFKRINVLVMPSITQESFGRVVIEAFAAGVPVVASQIGGLIEIVDDGVDGLLVPPADSKALCEAVIKIYKDPDKAGRMALSGRAKVEKKYTLTQMAEATLAVYEEVLSTPKILVIKLSALGDAILSIPSFEAIKKKFPASHVVCLCGKEVRDVFAACPYIDELIVYDHQGDDQGFFGLFSLAMRLKLMRFNHLIDLQNNKKSHLIAYFSSISHRYGYNNGKMSFLLNHRIQDSGEVIGPVLHQFRTLKMIGVDYDQEQLNLWPSKDDQAYADRFFTLKLKTCDKKLIGINVASSPRWQSKRWPHPYFVQLIDQLHQEGFAVLITGTDSDQILAQSICSKTEREPIDAVGQTTIMQLACLLKRCAVYVTGDSAPLHVAAAVGIPFVALFGPTSSDRHLPVAKEFCVLQLGCQPCYKPQCSKPRHQCMEDISVDDVMKAIRKLIN